MSAGGQVAIAFAVAIFLSFLAVPTAIAVAGRTGFLDVPSGYKAHRRPTPYLGGAAVLAAALPTMAMVDLGAWTRYWPLLVGAVFLFAVGSVDDRLNLSPWLRLGLEALAAGILWANGLGWSFLASEGANLLLTVFWIVGLVNAFNLMDNLDGAAGSVGTVCSASVAVLALLANDPVLATIAAALCGALLGFLRFNLARPARIFLGDGGSMPVGFLIAGLLPSAPMGDLSGWSTAIAAALVVGLPTFDTTLVVVSRRRRGIPVLTGGTDHTTHRLLAVLKSPRAVAAVLAVAQALLCGLAIEGTRLGEGALMALAAAVLLFGAATIAIAEGPEWSPVSDDS